MVATFRCKPTGKVELYKFRFIDVEPKTYVEYLIELDGAKQLAEIGLGGTILMNPIPYRNWPGTGGALLPHNREAIFQIRLPENALSATARIYCRSFSIGAPDEKDGITGNANSLRRR